MVVRTDPGDPERDKWRTEEIRQEQRQQPKRLLDYCTITLGVDRVRGRQKRNEFRQLECAERKRDATGNHGKQETALYVARFGKVARHQPEKKQRAD